MQEYRGLWFPDGDKNIIETMESERTNKGAPDFAGLPTFQFRKFAKAFELIKNFRVAVDVGGHVGLWSRVLAQLFSTVHAFEPIPAFAECFHRNVSSRNVYLHGCALGELNGVVTLTTRVSNSGITHITPHDEWHANGQVEAPLRMLDEFGLDDIDFLKIDVEGYERNVLLGGEQIIRKCKPCIIVEQKPGNAKRYGLPDIGAVTLLQKWGATYQWEFSGDFCLRWEKEKK